MFRAPLHARRSDDHIDLNFVILSLVLQAWTPRFCEQSFWYH